MKLADKLGMVKNGGLQLSLDSETDGSFYTHVGVAFHLQKFALTPFASAEVTGLVHSNCVQIIAQQHRQWFAN
jgi:hypothetical protein